MSSGWILPGYMNTAYNLGGYCASSMTGSESSRNTKKKKTYLERQEEEAEKRAQIKREAQDHFEKGIDKEGKEIKYAVDANGEFIRVAVDENGKIKLDENGQPISDPNGALVPDENGKVYSLEAIDEAKKKLEEGKQADGSILKSESAEEYVKKVPWYKRLGRAAGNMLQGVWDMGKSLVGFEKDGSWNWKKCVKNVAITAAAVGISCIPGLQWVGPTLLYAGIGMGAVQTGVGVYKAFNAKTVDEIDKAWQDTGVGIATLLASRSGLKGLASSVSKTNTAAVASDAANAAKAIKWYNAPELFKAVNAKNASMTGTFGQKFMKNLKELNPFSNKRQKEQFSRELNTVSRNANKRIAQIDAELSQPNLTPIQKNLLQAEKAAIKNSQNQALHASTRQNFVKLTEDSKISKGLQSLEKAKMQLDAGTPEVQVSLGSHTVRIKNTENNISQLESAIQSFKATHSGYIKLTKASNARYDGFISRLSRRNERELYNDGLKTSWQKTAWAYIKGAFNTGFKAFMWEYELYKAIPPAGQFYAQLDRMFLSQQHYEYGTMYDMIGGFAENFGLGDWGTKYTPTHLSAEEVAGKLAQLEKQESSLKETMQQYEAAQLKQFEEANLKTKSA